jgi:hypothetical protein
MAVHMKYWLTLLCVLGLAACGGSTPTSTSIPSALETPGAGQLGLKILSPENDAVVNLPQVEVKGTAPVGLVITINDDIILVDETGVFSATVPLEEGPNEIQIVASDVDGNEASLELIVTYEPES